MNRVQSIILLCVGLVAVLAGAVAQAAPNGDFIAVLDQRSTTSAVITNSQRSVVFYNAANMSSPLFSVFAGYERPDFNPEDPSSITVNPATGDVYVAAFDSGTDASVIDTGANPVGAGPHDGDTNADTDLYRISFQAAYNYWETHGQTYTTFYDYGTNPTLNPNDHHDNVVNLAGVNSKVGEVARSISSAAPFFDQRLNFVDQNTVLMMDNDSGVAANFATDDHAIRVLNRVSTSPGAANWNGQNTVASAGGFNHGTSESWESQVVGQLHMDPGQFSKPVGMAYVNRDGVEGAWVLEDDGAGDDVAFFKFHRDGNNKIDSMTMNTVFKLDNDPVGSPGAHDGDGGWIGVDGSGNLLVSESGFFDTPGTEPKIMIANVSSYNNAGTVNISGWSIKQLNIPNDDDTSFTDERHVVYDKAHNAVYYFDPDANEGAVPFFADVYKLDLNTGVTTTVTIDHDDFSWFNNEAVAPGELVHFSLTSGIVGDLDDNGVVDSHDIDILWNVIRPEVAGSEDPGSNDNEDLNGDGFVNEKDVDYMLKNLLTAGSNRSYGDADLDGGVGGLDYTAWRVRAGTGWANGDFDGDGGVGGLDYTLWRTRPTAYPSTVGPHGSGDPQVVPEPTSVVLMFLATPGLAIVALRRRAAHA